MPLGGCSGLLGGPSPWVAGLKVGPSPVPPGKELIDQVIVLAMKVVCVRCGNLEDTWIDPPKDETPLEVVERSVRVDDAVIVLDEQPSIVC
jgi:hypothetical protein